MKRLVLCLAFLALGCTPKGYIKIDTIEPLVRRVCDRHDRYVRSDENLSDTEERVVLRSSELVLLALEEAKKDPSAEPAEPTPASE